jgi:sec-independent protein translocase protein TatA
MGSLSVAHWFIVLIIIMLIFGTKKIGGIGGDLGKAVRGFKDGIKGNEDTENAADLSLPQTSHESTASTGRVEPRR